MGRSDLPVILILNDITNLNPIGVLIHELTHHLEAYAYDRKKGDTNHGYAWRLAKRRVIRWAYENISNKPDWSLPLRVYQTKINMRKFRV